MRNKHAVGAAIASALALALCGGALVGCGGDDDKKQNLKDEPLSATKIADFTTGNADDRKEVFESGSKGFSWENGSPFNVWWNADNVAYDNNVAQLSLSAMDPEDKPQIMNPEYDPDATPDPDNPVPEMIDCKSEYYGSELRTEHYYGYGDYQVSMKPSNVPGTVSSFFTYTGPSDVHYDTQEKNPHDEIDIEFLGKDTTVVQFNYIVNGVGGHEHKYKLGFDASKEFHTYGFRWTSEYIVWFVDQKPVYKVKVKTLPKTEGRVIMNYWCADENAEDWTGEFKDDFSGKAEYQWIATSAQPQEDPNVAPPAPPIEAPTEGWSDVDVSGFGNYNGPYTVTAATDSFTIAHTAAANDYVCAGMDLPSNYSWFKFKVKNNGDEEAKLRVDIKKKDAQNNAVLAVADAEGVTYDATNKAASITVAAGAEAEVACKLDSANITVSQLVLFLNSKGIGGTAATGNVTISEVKGIIAEPGADADIPDPELMIGDTAVKFSGSSYTITPNAEKDALTVSYTEMSDTSYASFGAEVADLIKDNNAFNFTIKNNGENDAVVRIDVTCTGKVYDSPYATYCNEKGTFTGLVDGDVVENGNNYLYGGGDWVKIKAGGTVTGKIIFKTGVEVGPHAVSFFADCVGMGGGVSHTGEIVLSGLSFTKEEIIEEKPTLPETGDWTTPVIFKTPAPYYPDGSESASFTVDAHANSINIKHDGAIAAGSNISQSVTYGSNNAMHMKITNNADVAAVLDIIVQNNEWANSITSAKLDGVDVTVEGWHTFVTIPAGTTVVFECTFNPEKAQNVCFGLNSKDNTCEAKGDITISEVCVKTVVEEGTVLPEGEGWTAISLTGSDAYVPDGTPTKYTMSAKANNITVSHTELPATNGTVGHVVTYGENNLVHLEIKNNDTTNAATVAILAQQTSGSWTDMASGFTVDGSSIEGNVVTVAAGATVVVEFRVGSGAGNIRFGVNNAADSSAAGNVTISKVAMKVAAAETPAE